MILRRFDGIRDRNWFKRVSEKPVETVVFSFLNPETGTKSFKTPVK